MIDHVKEWWEFVLVILGLLLAGVKWILGIQRDVKDLKDSSIMTTKMCDDRRSTCQGRNQMLFDTGTSTMDRLERMFSEERKRNEDRHNEVMRVLLEMNKQ